VRIVIDHTNADWQFTTKNARIKLKHLYPAIWLNLVEGFFSKLARSVLRQIRVSSKQELKDRLMAAVDYFNHDPVVHTWTYKLDKAA
jgi:hypothetical protein